VSRPGHQSEPVLALEVVPAEGARHRRPEELAAERPLELRLGWPGSDQSALGVTMRTPGQDFELAVGLLVAEGLLAERDEVERITIRSVPDEAGGTDVIEVVLRHPPKRPPAPRLLATSSACGLCGTQPGASMLDTLPTLDPPSVLVRDTLLVDLPDRLQAHQPVFARTGGLHGAALFDALGHLVVAREDIGRHNAVHKVVGALVLGGAPRPDPAILVVSGRAGYEIVQKAAMARLGVVVAVSAPSSLAVEAARRSGIVLAAFARQGRAVVYAGADHLASADGPGRQDDAPGGDGGVGLDAVSQLVAAHEGPVSPRDPGTGPDASAEEPA
jgi:FdhD protein